MLPLVYPQKFRLIKNSKIHKDIFLVGVDTKKDQIIDKITDAFELVPFANDQIISKKLKKL